MKMTHKNGTDFAPEEYTYLETDPLYGAPWMGKHYVSFDAQNSDLEFVIQPKEDRLFPEVSFTFGDGAKLTGFHLDDNGDYRLFFFGGYSQAWY